MADETRARTQQVWFIVRVDDYFNGGTGDQEVVAVAYSEETARKLTKYVNASVEPPEAYGYRTAEMTVPAQANEPRAIVRAFALAMERKLAVRDENYGSWRQSDLIELMDALLHEAEELRAAWVMQSRYSGPAQDVLMEAVDVAAYAMFIADVCGALPPTDERGR